MSNEEVWGHLKLAFDESFMVTSACFIEWNGLIGGQGYVVQGVYEIPVSGGETVKLVKVRNPFKQIGDTSLLDSSHGDWTGKFSSGDSQSWDFDLKQKAGYQFLKDGEFFMSLDDFKQGFKYFTITYMHQGWKQSFIEKRSSVNRRLYKFNFTIV